MRNIFFLLIFSAQIYTVYGWSLFKIIRDRSEIPLVQPKPIIESGHIKSPTLVTVLLDPAGDAKDPGRTIDDTFERSITLLFCQKLKQLLEEKNSSIRVIITKNTTDIVDQEHNASFSNQVKADLYIHISTFQTYENYLQIYLYYFTYHPVTDFWHKKNRELSFIPFDQAYLHNLTKTAGYAKIIGNSLKANGKMHNYIFTGPYSVPYKPLRGIMAPSFALELGLSNKNSWHILISSVLEAINLTVKKIDYEKNSI